MNINRIYCYLFFINLSRALAAYSAHWPSTARTGRAVRADLNSKMGFGPPTWTLYSQTELQFVLQMPFKGQFRGHWTYKNHEKSTGKQMFFVGSPFWPFECAWTALRGFLGAFWVQLGVSWANLGALGRLWGPTWGHLGAS